MKPAPKPPAGNGSKPAAKASPPPAKPAPAKPAPATEPAKKPAPAPALSAPFVSPPPGPLAPKATPGFHPKPTVSGPLTLSVQTSAGAAASGNNHPANILVIVTCAGAPLTELTKDNFTLMEHFDIPGQQAPFSNNITSFRNAGTGAYLLQTKPITGAPWRSGHHLAQLLVSSPDDQQGQSALKFVIR
ncbi:MAG TPA: hypothetical protein VD994_22035 [Prosthecobacter sp.]|nr:hypothetical protein [Prosthecobacter sp.]